MESVMAMNRQFEGCSNGLAADLTPLTRTYATDSTDSKHFWNRSVRKTYSDLADSTDTTDSNPYRTGVFNWLGIGTGSSVESVDGIGGIGCSIMMPSMGGVATDNGSYVKLSP